MRDDIEQIPALIGQLFETVRALNANSTATSRRRHPVKANRRMP